MVLEKGVFHLLFTNMFFGPKCAISSEWKFAVWTQANDESKNTMVIIPGHSLSVLEKNILDQFSTPGRPIAHARAHNLLIPNTNGPLKCILGPGWGQER